MAKIWYGADYNPEQWEQSVWLEDVALMKEAHVNMVTPGVFSWSMLEPQEGVFQYEWMDRLLDLLHANDIRVDLGTGTATQPPWLSVHYPDVLPVKRSGGQTGYGGRQFFCPTSPSYRKFAARLVRRTARRYANHPAIAMFHINNEYTANSLDMICYCERCQGLFQSWLRARYKTIKQLNQTWGTNFWSQRYSCFEEISAPVNDATHPAQRVDYQRFQDENYRSLYQMEAEILREECGGIPVTTNFFMPEFKRINHHRWADMMERISFDCYSEPTAQYPIGKAAMYYELMRGLKRRPFYLMEQSPSAINWRAYNPQKRPGVMALWSLQAVAHGADAIMFFQWRQSLAGNERFHGAIVPHCNRRDARIFREVCQLGEELEQLSDVVDTESPHTVALLWDYESFLSVDDEIPHKDITYLEEAWRWYRALYEQNYDVRVISSTKDLARYRVVLAPLHYMMNQEQASDIEAFVRNGGCFVSGFFSGIVNEASTVHAGGYPGPLRDVLGIEVEEFDSLTPDMGNQLTLEGKHYRCSQWCEVLHLTTAQSVCEYAADYYAGSPCITQNALGTGQAWYVSTVLEDEAQQHLMRMILQPLGITPVIEARAPLEAVPRGLYLFLLNHGDTAQKIACPMGWQGEDEVYVPARGYRILKRKQEN